MLPKECIRLSPAEEIASIFASFQIVLLAGDSSVALDTILKSSSVDYIKVDLQTRKELLAELA